MQEPRSVRFEQVESNHCEQRSRPVPVTVTVAERLNSHVMIGPKRQTAEFGLANANDSVVLSTEDSLQANTPQFDDSSAFAAVPPQCSPETFGVIEPITRPFEQVSVVIGPARTLKAEYKSEQDNAAWET